MIQYTISYSVTCFQEAERCKWFSALSSTQLHVSKKQRGVYDSARYHLLNYMFPRSRGVYMILYAIIYSVTCFQETERCKWFSTLSSTQLHVSERQRGVNDSVHHHLLKNLRRSSGSAHCLILPNDSEFKYLQRKIDLLRRLLKKLHSKTAEEFLIKRRKLGFDELTILIVA